MKLRSWTLAPLCTLVLCACSDDAAAPDAGDTGTHFVFDQTANLTESGRFFDLPFPSDLRLTDDGAPDVRGFPQPPVVTILSGLLEIVGRRKGWPTIPVAYMRFSDALPELDVEAVMAGEESDPILLLDIDPQSPQRGRLVPAVAFVPEEDPYVPGPLLAVAARPGFVLRPSTTHAVVVRRSLGDAEGRALGRSEGFEALKPGGAAVGSQAGVVYAPLWGALAEVGIAVDDVAAATVFTTGDVVQETFDMGSGLLARETVSIDGLVVDTDDGHQHERFCELHGTVNYPQFQRGKAPYNTDGLFETGADGLPAVQRMESAPVVITIPKVAMPADGYPLTIYFHGSGGVSQQVVDRPDKGQGPAHVLAAHGFATASSALPLNPERYAGAEDTAYLNINNPKAFVDTFRQGVFEQRLFLEALRSLRVSPATLESCTGVSLPAGVAEYRFAEQRLTAMGQSMGGMYTNLVASTEPRIAAVVPTGAGGYWSYFILKTQLIPGAAGLLALVLGTDAKLTFMHPAMHVLELAWEPAEPLVYMPRIATDPLAAHPVRPIFEPVGQGDSYFTTDVYDAVAIAYGNEQAGSEVWPTMQQALALAGRGELLGYPVSQNRQSRDGTAHTGVVVQYAGDGSFDTHSIAFELDDVKYQYGCFLSSFFATGIGTVPQPRPLIESCPE